MYSTTRIPILLVYEVYKRACRISIINSSSSTMLTLSFEESAWSFGVWLAAAPHLTAYLRYSETAQKHEYIGYIYIFIYTTSLKHEVESESLSSAKLS